MTEDKKALQQELNREFHKHLHTEKLKTQAERAKYIFTKIAFITGLFGLGSLTKLSALGNTIVATPVFYGLFFLIPLFTIGYDLYIHAADSSIKKMGAFLGKNPESGSGDSEKAWETSSVGNRDKIAPRASFLFSCIATIAAWLYFLISEYKFSWECKEELFLCNFIIVWPSVWFIICLVIIILIHKKYSDYIKEIDESYSDTLELCNRENKRWKHF